MAIKIPDELKADMPRTAWGKILSATPIVMTVLATLLAGLTSSEMTRAQYGRSLAAQQQSKAGDQWGYFQAKRLRGAMQRNSLDLLQSTTEIHPLAAETLAAAEPAVAAALATGQLPATTTLAPLDGRVQEALGALEKPDAEAEVAALLANVNKQTLDGALSAAKMNASSFDAALRPVNQAIERLEKSLGPNRDLIAARLRYTAQRYETEARLNQVVANLYELQVRQSNFTAERHHRRSEQFFYGMLAAQAAVIISTFAMAARQRNLLWSLAAAAGLVAVAFGIYVYLNV